MDLLHLHTRIALRRDEENGREAFRAGVPRYPLGEAWHTTWALPRA